MQTAIIVVISYTVFCLIIIKCYFPEHKRELEISHEEAMKLDESEFIFGE